MMYYGVVVAFVPEKLKNCKREVGTTMEITEYIVEKINLILLELLLENVMNIDCILILMKKMSFILKVEQDFA